LQILDRFVNPLKAGEQGAQDCKALVDIERDHILHALEKTGWRIEGNKGATDTRRHGARPYLFPTLISTFEVTSSQNEYYGNFKKEK
jgi:hypothetical protein